MKRQSFFPTRNRDFLFMDDAVVETNAEMFEDAEVLADTAGWQTVANVPRWRVDD